MNRDLAEPIERAPRWWRMLIIALSVLVLCSCTVLSPYERWEDEPVPSPALSEPASPQEQKSPKSAALRLADDPPPALPADVEKLSTPRSKRTAARTPQRRAAPVARSQTSPQKAIERSAPLPIQPTASCQPPLSEQFVTPWRPPGIACPWPPDEYLCDGGDRDVQATVSDQGETVGLETEDTVVYYRTADGKLQVEPSNRVCIYAPRFAAVRKIEGARLDQQNDAPLAASLPLKVNLHDDEQPPQVTGQRLRPHSDMARRSPNVARLRQGDGRLVSEVQLMAVAEGLLPYENFRLVSDGVLEAAEKARLLVSIDAAIQWTHDLGVQVAIAGVRAGEVSGDARAQVTFRVDSPGNAKLRVIKMASTKTALPGEVVEFTLRYDNCGDQVLDSVSIVDNLTTRLEYVAGTARSSRKAQFSSQQNEGQSLVMRWELAEPLKPGEGGIVRFQCKVR